VKLTVVGCSGSIPGPESPASCYLVQAPFSGRTFSLVVDLGPGALGALYRFHDPGQVDAFALSHLHPDHCLDMCAYYVLARYSPTGAWPTQPVYAPRGAGERLSRAYDVPPSDGPTDEAGPTLTAHFRFRDWQATQQIGPFTVTTVPVDHPVEAYAIRITHNVPGGGSLVYSGDTGPCDALVELARGADVFLCEASWTHSPDRPPKLHLSGTEAGQMAAAAGVSELLLTHIPPWTSREDVISEAKAEFDGPVHAVVCGETFDVPRR
jgi:ribonuclease BN (tRNA processing enzyme)